MELWTQLLSRVVELYFVKAVVSWRGQVKRTTAGPVKTFAAVGLNLLKESEISAPQPEEIYFFIFIFNCNLVILLFCNISLTVSKLSLYVFMEKDF